MLKPRLDYFFENLYNNHEKLFDIVNTHNTPINILYGKNFLDNIDNFINILNKYDLKNEIFYAHKSNKSKLFLNLAKQKNIGIDVASVNELTNALKIGFESSKIEATGPKSKDFLELCLFNNILINVDSFSELESIKKIKVEKNINEKTSILIRLSGFEKSKISRFGIEISRKQEIINYIIKNQINFNLVGFSFHIDTVSFEEKAFAIEEVLLLYRDFLNLGIYLRKINIGGGFRLSYLEDVSSWDNYLDLLKEELVDSNLVMSWRKSSFGFNYDGKKVIGDGNIYTPYSNLVKELFLENIINYKLKNFGNLTIGEYLKENLIKIQIEPGRALHDLTGATISQVIGVKEVSGEILVILDINSFSLGSKEQEMFIDPIIVTKGKKNISDKGVFLVGNLCLESDFIYRHKSFLGVIPNVGDLVIFSNTGGYFMDFYENNAIGQELAKKIVIDDNYDIYLEN